MSEMEPQDEPPDPSQVENITSLETARMTLRWALERMRALEKARAEQEKRAETQTALRQKSDLENEALKRDQRELYYKKLEEFVGLHLAGKLGVPLPDNDLREAELAEANRKLAMAEQAASRVQHEQGCRAAAELRDLTARSAQLEQQLAEWRARAEQGAAELRDRKRQLASAEASLAKFAETLAALCQFRRGEREETRLALARGEAKLGDLRRQLELRETPSPRLADEPRKLSAKVKELEAARARSQELAEAERIRAASAIAEAARAREALAVAEEKLAQTERRLAGAEERSALVPATEPEAEARASLLAQQELDLARQFTAKKSELESLKQELNNQIERWLSGQDDG